MPHDLVYGLVTAITFILVLGLLVLVHELGHFLTARLFKVRVEEFGVGFPPRAYPNRETVARRRAAGKTVYSINWLPLGGFVRLAGENGVSTPPPDAGTTWADEPREGARFSLSGSAVAADDPVAFANKPAWQRAIILVAGAFNNMVLAMALLFCMFVFIGTPQTTTEIVGVALRSPADAAHLMPGDYITRVNGQSPRNPDDVRTFVLAQQGRPATLQILRGNKTVTVTLTPRDTSTLPCDQGALGVMTNPIKQHNVPTGVGTALNASVNIPGAVVQGLVGLVNQQPATTVCEGQSVYRTFGNQLLSAAELQRQAVPGAVQQDPCLAGVGGGVTGPIGIIRQVGCEANAIPAQGWVPLLTLVVELSATLAIVNLLPIPALDGGRLLFVLISVVARRRVRPEVEGMAHALGMVALLTLMFVISWHDVINLISNKPAF